MPIDLRSDTITCPTDAMRSAMARAEVGDDVFGDDPTVAALEGRVAEMLGHEAALFVASGTMGNVIALRVHTRPGDEVITEYTSHIFVNEAGGAAAICGVMMHTLAAESGILQPEAVRAAIRTADIHHPRTRLVTMENTHNYGGGAIYPLETMEGVARVAREAGVSLHLDGARLWNASAESGIPLDRHARLFDSVSVCFSKGLGAPVGSMLVGSRPFIAEARRVRKMLGGGMRQVGILAAAADHALTHHLPRLREDHEKARALARAACRIDGVRLAQKAVETNIVFLDVAATGWDAERLVERLEVEGLRTLSLSPTQIRLVTHLQVGEDDVARASGILERVLAEPSRRA